MTVLTVKLIEFFKTYNTWVVFMGEKCQNCNKKMDSPELTHCSDECLFDEIKYEKSTDGMSSIDDWDSNPWI